MRGLPGIAAGLALPLVVAGCGGGPSSTASGSDASPADQARSYLAAFARGDGKTACALLTPQARAGVPALSDDLTSPTCEGAIRELSRSSEHPRASKVSVVIKKDQAIARITARPRYDSPILLRKGDDGWRIAFPPAIVPRFKTPPGIPSD